MVKAIIFGASGGLALAVGRAFLDRGWHTDLVTRETRYDAVRQRFAGDIDAGKARVHSVARRYSEFLPSGQYDAFIFAPALFEPMALTQRKEASIEAEIDVGLTDPVRLTRNFLLQTLPTPDQRRDFCYIGSTSAYAGFRNTSVYCAVKHGLLGFVRAMNDEYGKTNTRFWLFSMGTMNTEMGRKLVEQDAASFLQVDDVAGRIVDAVCSRSNLFEPEIILRRRSIRFLEP